MKIMPCNEWKETWVASLYDELDPAEERELLGHLDSCDSCRRHLDELAVSRQTLHDACPVVPASPSKVVVLRPRRLLQPLWAYAAGAACAMLVFAVGLLAGYKLPSSVSTGTGPVAANPPALAEDAIEARFDALLRRVDRLEQEEQRPSDDLTQQAYLTMDRFEEEMRQMNRRNDVERAKDFQFLLDEITAAELRTGSYINDTRQALQVVAVKSDPRFKER
jgi:hypothetical protein